MEKIVLRNLATDKSVEIDNPDFYTLELALLWAETFYEEEDEMQGENKNARANA